LAIDKSIQAFVTNLSHLPPESVPTMVNLHRPKKVFSFRTFQPVSGDILATIGPTCTRALSITPAFEWSWRDWRPIPGAEIEPRCCGTPAGQAIEVDIFESINLPGHWLRLDGFEGAGHATHETYDNIDELHATAIRAGICTALEALEETRPELATW